jgi:hypothetical protein
METLFGINSKILTTNSGAEIGEHARQLLFHFENYGGPVMIGNYWIYNYNHTNVQVVECLLIRSWVSTTIQKLETAATWFWILITQEKRTCPKFWPMVGAAGKVPTSGTRMISIICCCPSLPHLFNTVVETSNCYTLVNKFNLFAKLFAQPRNSGADGFVLCNATSKNLSAAKRTRVQTPNLCFPQTQLGESADRLLIFVHTPNEPTFVRPVLIMPN